MKRTPEMRTAALAIVVDLMQRYGLTVDDIRPGLGAPMPRKASAPAPAPAGTPDKPASPPAAYGERRQEVFALLQSEAPRALSATEIASRLDVPKQRIQVLLTGYRAAGYVTSSGPHKHVVWKLNTSRPLPAAPNRSGRPAAPPPASKPKQAATPAPAPVPVAATGCGRAVTAQALQPALRLQGSSRSRVSLQPAPRPQDDREVIIPPSVKRTLAPPAPDHLYQVADPSAFTGEFTRDWQTRRAR